MLRRIQLILVCCVLSVFAVQAQNDQGTLRGKVLDKGTGEPLPFVNIVLELNGVQKYGGSTDFDGVYTVKPVTPGSYDLKVSFVGYKPQLQKGVVINGGNITFLDVKLTSSVEVLEEFEVIEYTVPLINKDGGASGGTVTRDDIAKMPGRSATSIATTVGGVSSDANGNITSIRGSRGDASYYYIDGIKVRGSTSLPKSAIEQVTVITGGLPANYGDATGGIISITTRGPSSKFFGGVEVLTSGFRAGDKVVGLDAYGYNLVEGSVSGPLLFRKDSADNKTTPILGFFLSGNFIAQEDGRPSAIPNWKIKDDVLADLIASPIRPTGLASGGAFYNTDFLDMSSFEEVKTRPNVASRSVSLAGKIDVNTGPNVNLTLGGSFAWNRGRIYNYNSSLYNSNNYGLNTNYSWRTYAKFTQRFSNGLEEENTGGIQNAYYTVMVDYSKVNGRSEDADHKDNIFNYGYIGQYITHRSKSYDVVVDGNGNPSFVQSGTFGERDDSVKFFASQINSEMASITNQYFSLYDEIDNNYENFTQIVDGGGLRNGDLPESVYQLWTNFGTNYNNYSYSDAAQFRITASGSADIGNHALSLGFEYEQRTDRAFSVAPIGLWGLMRQMTNFHLQELDQTTAQQYLVGTTFFTDYDRLVGDPFTFSANLRDRLGMDPLGTELVDVDAIPEDQLGDLLTLDLFSADELLNQGQTYVAYYGYDHTGEKLTSNPSFDDFFNLRDENGDFVRPIAPFQPIYIAGYVMDKFAFDDIIFNVGVRVDRFDANQQVLKDKFLLYEARTAGEVANIGGLDVEHPSNIPNEAVVYVNDINEPTAINGYRDGDTWYNADGVVITDPSVLQTSSGIAPYLIDPAQTTPSSGAFKDYEPQVVVMPRVAFSFPISDEALFFAHYDILSKRPTNGNRLDPIDYLFMETRNVILNNPDLRPEKTIDYELGFQQVLSKSSSLKISVFYRELRDMVQLVNINQAYPRTYRTFGNIDFGTIKGITLSYDLRRTGNVWMRAAYTLQFAEGTGSSSTTALNLVNSGQPNLRTISPFSYDQRHQITATLDYRYGEGKDYNGPVWFGKRIFENTGVNFQSNLASGTPYSAQSNITPEGIGGGSSSLEGQINGSRKPWQFRVDAQMDRNIVLKWGGEDKKKSANLNVYLLVNNLFNTLNVVNVYRATGNPDDDGYLAAAEFQASIEQQNDEAAFRELYALKVNNPGNYGIPRTIRLGVKLDF